ncbi:MAG TPA: hypothetical protein VEL82_04875 [Thermoplasmata archaeon]|nr:hypothetical protein [Thermoplasmata archaeon]
MIVGLLGRLFRSIGRVRGGDAGRDLAHVGDELVRLDARSAQAATAR